ncbi:MAG: hypothetical protein DRG63_05555 [Deltaproteobacteria bacterium]|nr:MAG: hypothetical protein DRG63_05555 [Deltaproteobacteria bacterium]
MSHYSVDDIENIIYHLNYRWRLQSLALWSGRKCPIAPDQLYQGFEAFLRVETLEDIDKISFPDDSKEKLRSSFMDHYLQRELLPYDMEMRTWMKGAAAHVDGRKIYFRDIISFCQKGSTRSQRLILQKETGPLCKFLKPFALSYWEALLQTLRRSFGFRDYREYCGLKKGVDYGAYYEEVKRILSQTDDLYFSAMEQWTKRCFEDELHSLTRFDAIYLLGLTEFDSFFPSQGIERFMSFFRYWDMDLTGYPGIHMELGQAPEKSSQAICFILQVPEEIYVLMKPQGGWLDLESLGHELGHALFAANTAEGLPFVVKELSRSSSLTEAFAFLVQNVSMSVPFMTGGLGVDEEIASMLYYHKVLKDMSVFRRYAARFLAEYEMFGEEDLANGEIYAENMARYTGFYYQPEACLFDLAGEFYSLDYVLAWMAEAMLEDYFHKEYGDAWMFSPDTGQTLKRWWREGHRNDLFGFLDRIGLGRLSSSSLIDRWKRILS